MRTINTALTSKEEKKAYMKEWRKANKERIKDYEKQRYANSKAYFKKQNKQWYESILEKNPNYNRQRHLKHYYGITLEQWNDTFNLQGGCCKICGIHQSELKRGLVTDHDHITGQFRGLLCDACNTKLGPSGLGHFKVTDELYSKALGYITLFNN